MKPPELSLTIPCYNEEASIGETAPALVRAFEEAGVVLELVLVDNGSTDNTSQVLDDMIADGLPATKVSIATNTGYSPGIIRGLEACTAPIIGFVMFSVFSATGLVSSSRKLQSPLNSPAMPKFKQILLACPR